MSKYQEKHARRERLYGDTIPDFVQHGRYTTYTNWRCRCEPCTVAWREYLAGRKAERTGDPATPHGTPSGYHNWNCRCEPCRDAWRRHGGMLPAGFPRHIVYPETRGTSLTDLAQWFAWNSTESIKAISEAMGKRIGGRAKGLPARRRGVNGWSLADLDRIHPDLLTRGESVQRE